MIRNYDIKTTSRTEGAHRLIKRLLRKRKPDLLKLKKTIDEMMSRQEFQYLTKLANQEEASRSKWQKEVVMAKLNKAVSVFAMEWIYSRVKFLQKKIEEGDPLTELIDTDGEADTRWQQMGLPSTSTLFPFVRHNRVIQLTDVDHHWWLKRNVADSERLRRLQETDPNKAVMRLRHENGPQEVGDWAWPEGDKPAAEAPAKPKKGRGGRIKSHDELPKDPKPRGRLKGSRNANSKQAIEGLTDQVRHLTELWIGSQAASPSTAGTAPPATAPPRKRKTTATTGAAAPAPKRGGGKPKNTGIGRLQVGEQVMDFTTIK